MVGVHYHASVDGLAAASGAFALLDREPPAPGAVPAPDLRAVRIRLTGVGVVHAGRDRATPAGLDLAVAPGEVVALTGPSGAGKSSAVLVLLGLRRPDAGRVTLEPLDDAARRELVLEPTGLEPTGLEPTGLDLGDLDLADLEPASWFAQVAWVPQRPLIVPGTLAENVRLAHPQTGDDDLQHVAELTGLTELVDALPQGWRTPIGQGGVGLSAGQRQRLALARALLRPASLVVLDEPTAHLDPGTEHVVHAAIARLRDAGHAVVLVAHRPALVALADRAVTVHDGPLAADPLFGAGAPSGGLSGAGCPSAGQEAAR
jgi:ATP-binding cassette subfamily C protein CydD